jgi:hypothetical protein
MTLTGVSQSGTGSYRFDGSGGEYSVETYSGAQIASTRFIAGSSLSTPAVTPSLSSSDISISISIVEVVPGKRIVTAGVISSIYFSPMVSNRYQLLAFSDTFQVTECAEAVIGDLELQHMRRSNQEASFQPGPFPATGSAASGVIFPSTVYSTIRTPALSKWFSGSSFRVLGGVAKPALAQDVQQYYDPIYLAERIDVPGGILYIDADMPEPRDYPMRQLLDGAGFSHIVTSGELYAVFTSWELASHGEVDGSYEVRYRTKVSLGLDRHSLKAEKDCEVIYRVSSATGLVVDGNLGFREQIGAIPRADGLYTAQLRTVDGEGFNNWAGTGGDPDLIDLAGLLNDRFAAYADRSGGFSGHFYETPSILSRITYWNPTSARTAANYFHGDCLPNFAVVERYLDRSRLGSRFLDDFSVVHGIDLRIGCANLDPDRARPDVAVGTSGKDLRGVLIFEPAWSQKILLFSSRLRTVRALATISNQGNASAAMRVSGTPGNRHFRVVYQTGGSNISAVTAVGNLDIGVRSFFDDPFPISILVSPDKKKLSKRIKRRTVIIRKNFLISISATTIAPNPSTDAAQLQVQTR